MTPQNLDGERRQVTALFADVVGSTAIAERLGEESHYRFMQDVISDMTIAVQDHGGVVEKLTGDGVMALFGAPLAMEDSTLNACRAGLDIISRMESSAEAVAAELGERLQVRVGVNTGYAVLANIAGRHDAYGDAINLAARLESLAGPDTMVIGESTNKLVADFTETEYLGEHAVKGKKSPQRAWRVLGLKSGVRRFDAAMRRGLTKLVGREQELEMLLDHYAASMKGHVKVIDIVGEPGIGKSRLVHEFRQRLDPERLMWLEGNCTDNGSDVAFLPFIEIVRTAIGVSAEDDEPTVRRRLERGLDILGIEPEGAIDYFLNLLGYEVTGSEFTKDNSEVAGIRTRNLLIRFLSERCRISSTVLFFEDVHWIDSASEALLHRLVEEFREMRLVIVFAHRPNYKTPWAKLDGIVRIQVTQLSGSSTEELLRARLGIGDPSPALVRLVVAKAEGNPLFAEEIINFLVDRKMLNAVTGEKNLDMGGLPVSLENILMARVDDLEEGPKILLQAAAVIGRYFHGEVAGEAAGVTGRTADFLAHLESRELVRPTETSGEYQIKHALLQDAVYGSLLIERRAEFHERIAEVLERRNAGRLGEIVETLAHHYQRTSRAEKAVLYMAQAGKKSLRVYSLDEAELRLSQVVALIEKAPDCADDDFLIDVALDLARVLYFRIDPNGLIRLLEPLLPKAEALGDPNRLARLLFELAFAHSYACKFDIAQPLLHRAHEVAERSGDKVAMGYAELGLAFCGLFSSFDANTRSTMEARLTRAEAAGKEAGELWLASMAIVFQSMMNLFAGRPDEVRRHGRRLMELSRETGDPRPRTMALWSLGYCDALHFAAEEAMESGRECQRLALNDMDKISGEFALGTGLLLSGHPEEGREIIERVTDFFKTHGFTGAALINGPMVGVAKILTGEMAAGEKRITDTANTCRLLGIANVAATCNFVLGDVYTRIVTSDEKPPLRVILKNLGYMLRTVPVAHAKAVRHLTAALEYYRTISAPSFIASTLFNLGLLDKKKNRMDAANAKFDEARELAASVGFQPMVEMIDEVKRVD